MTDSQKLLTDYVSNASEVAFREIVTRYFDLVYSTAVRLVGGDTHLARDVAQTVFVDLARQAGKLSRDVRLGGWLHRHTCFIAAKTLRGERRRQARERQAADMNNAPSNHSEAHLRDVAPILDEAINQLGAVDRAAVLLRFYERLDYGAIGNALGSNEAAAQKRVSRSLEKLQILLKRQGVTFSAAALGTALASEAVTAAPIGMAAGVAGTAFSSTFAGGGAGLTLFEIMATSKLKAGIAAAVVFASVATPFLLQRQAQAATHAQAEGGRQLGNQVSQMAADNERLARLLARATNSPKDAQFLEVLRLRGEVGRLTRDVREMAAAKPPGPPSREDQLVSLKEKYAARVERLKQWFADHPSERIPEFQLIKDDHWINAVATLETDDDLARYARMLRLNAEDSAFGTLVMALRAYAKDSNGQFPADLSDLKPYFKSPLDDAIFQRYTILPASSLASELQPGGDWVITQKAPANPDLDSRTAWSLTNFHTVGPEVPNRWSLAR